MLRVPLYTFYDVAKMINITLLQADFVATIFTGSFVFCCRRGAKLDQLQILDTLLSNYDRRSTPTNHLSKSENDN